MVQSVRTHTNMLYMYTYTFKQIYRDTIRGTGFHSDGFVVFYWRFCQDLCEIGAISIPIHATTSI